MHRSKFQILAFTENEYGQIFQISTAARARVGITHIKLETKAHRYTYIYIYIYINIDIDTLYIQE